MENICERIILIFFFRFFYPLDCRRVSVLDKSEVVRAWYMKPAIAVRIADTSADIRNTQMSGRVHFNANILIDC